MVPKVAFDNIIERAETLETIHDGIVNTRRRGIRSDWKDSFCRLMHWPVSSSIARVDSAQAVIVLRDGASLSDATFSADGLDDILRSALVMGVSALDRYVHERVREGIVRAFRRRGLSREQRDFAIPLTLALDAMNSLRRAQRQGRAVRPANEIRKAIQEMLHEKPLQNWRDIEGAFCLIGITGITGEIQASLGLPNLDEYKKEYRAIIARRHRIVHEGDLERHERGGRPKKNRISSRFVRRSLDFLKKFVAELEKL